MILFSGRSISHQLEDKVSRNLVFMSIIVDLSSLLISIPTMIPSLDGNLLCLRKEDISSLERDLPFGHLKIIRCVLIMTELKDRELFLMNILLSRSELVNSMQEWRNL